MRIGEVAQLAGVSPRMLRHYHAIGVLPEPPRGENGYRDYGPEALLRVLRLRQLVSLGLSLSRAAEVLDEGREGRPDASGSPSSDALLAELDAALASKISELERRRALVAELRRGDVPADVPPGAASALRAVEEFASLAGEVPSPAGDPLLSEDRMAVDLAAHLYSDDELAEVERVVRAISARGLMGKYRAVAAEVESLASDASRAERDAAVAACLRFVDKIFDCFDAANWNRADRDYELFLDAVASEQLNEAQREVSERVFAAVGRRMATRPAAGPVDV